MPLLTNLTLSHRNCHVRTCQGFFSVSVGKVEWFYPPAPLFSVISSQHMPWLLNQFFVCLWYFILILNLDATSASLTVLVKSNALLNGSQQSQPLSVLTPHLFTLVRAKAGGNSTDVCIKRVGMGKAGACTLWSQISSPTFLCMNGDLEAQFCFCFLLCICLYCENYLIIHK